MNQHNDMKNRRAIGLTLGLPAIIGTIAFLLWADDVRRDRQHTVTVRSATPLFAGSGKNCEAQAQIGLAQQGATFAVQRIRYWKDCATADVTLSDGRLSHIILGVGNTSVHPFLP